MSEIRHLNDRDRYVENGDTHRTNGPASIWHNGFSFWALRNDLHRYYGPAVLENRAWWIHGERVK